jgi:hypothetical protein
MDNTTLVSKGGRFQAGTTGGGNPKGRPKGKVSAVTALIRSACPQIIEVVIEAAKAGDLQACALLLSRGVPTLRPTLEPVKVLTAAQLKSMTASQRADAINAAALSGVIPADVAVALIDGIAKSCAVLEHTTFEERLAALEQAQGHD